MFAPLSVKEEAPLFSVTPVTAEPIAPLIVVAPLLEPEFVIVPVLFIEELSPIVPAPFAFRVMFPVLLKLPAIELLEMPWFQVTFILPV